MLILKSNKRNLLGHPDSNWGDNFVRVAYLTTIWYPKILTYTIATLLDNVLSEQSLLIIDGTSPYEKVSHLHFIICLFQLPRLDMKIYFNPRTSTWYGSLNVSLGLSL